MSSATVTGFRLSPQQRHLWPLQTANPSFNAWVAIMLTGPVDVDLLQNALSEIVARHEILKTSYQRLSGMKLPVQVIADFAPVELRTIDLRNPWPDEAQAIDEFIAAEAGETFDYERGPLARAALAALPSDRYLLVVTLHAICADSLTLRNLFQEISGIYVDPGSAAEPEAEVVQYLQFSEWQHELLEESDAEEGRDYWKKQQLADLLDKSLQFEEEFATAERFDPAVFRFEAGSDPTTAMSLLARKFHITLSDLLLACWQVLNLRLNDGEDVVVGKSFDGRKYEELEKAFGIFSKTLPLRIELKNDKRFSEIIRATAEQSREAEQWQDYFVWQQDGGSNESPAGSIKLAFEYFEAPPSQTASETACSLYRFYSCPDTYLVKLVCIHENERMRFELHYDQRSIRRGTVERIAGHLDTLLRSVVRDPFERIGSLEILNDTHREELFTTLSGKVEPVPHTCIHELFEQQAEQWPQRIAVACEDDNITYKELDERANQLAHRLKRLGVGSEIAVGICLPPSIDLLVAILGVLKSGGFYVPLDPAYPHDRLSFILNDTGAAVLISERSFADEIFGGQLTTLFMEEEREALAAEPTSKPDAGVAPGNLAYVIYTSGSTGRPKGVLVSHENVVHSTLARSVYYEESLTTYLLLSSFSFDSSVAGLFWTLCSGATLLLPAADARREVPALVELIRGNQVSHLLCLPSLYPLLLEAAGREDLESLRCVIVAGEACPVDLPEKHQRATDASLYNEYGPTEGTVWASVYKIERNAKRQIPIGSPIANTQIYILDDHLQPVPFGVSGELFIGGRGITRGYLNSPGITTEKFVPDQFTSTTGSRLYRTGDRARCRPNGEIDFLGRFDQQVKLRGYRIELGEIEAVLAKHPQVQETVCLVEQVEQDDERLLAFVVPRPMHLPVFRGHQRYRLPNHAAIVEHGRNEADFLYHELFEQQIYFKHGISLQDGDCVFDVGAHIGLFTMMLNRTRNNLRVYAFEPAKPLFELLQINTELYCDGVKLFRCGLSNRVGAATLTFYPSFSMMSSFYADPQAEARTMKSFIQLQQTSESPEVDADEQYYDELLSSRFESEPYESELKTLHAVIEDEGIEQIDLLKIDVEKSELDVFTGADENDWRKIRQVVAHVHDIDSRLATVISLLEKFGFRVIVEEDQSVNEQGLYYVYATRNKAMRTESSPVHLAPFDDTILKKADLAAYTRERLPEFMVPSNFILLETLPLLPNGKLNRRALLESVDTAKDQERAFVAPSTPLEELLAGIWSEVLKTDRIGIHDNFFDLGGHSFLAIKAHSRLSKTLGREIPLLKLFEYPTLQSLASFLEQTEEKSVPVAQTQDWAEKRRQAIIGQRQPRRTENGQASRN
jgi:amino acid adenylation domain-containing protein/FkbM family methyltransferase